MILIGDAIEQLATRPAKSVHCCVTSPPYWNLRDYGVDGQIGLEATPEEYIAKMVEVCRAVWRVLRDDGTLWLNIGDSYASGKGKCHNPGGGGKSYIQDKQRYPLDRGNKSTLDAIGLKPKDLVGIPWMLAFALRADGWYLRSDLPWIKRNPMPGSEKDRPATTVEHVFLLAKKRKYFYDEVAVQVPATGQDGGACFGKVERDGPGSRRISKDENAKVRGKMRARRSNDWFFDSWQGLLSDGDGGPLAFVVNTFAYPKAHYATFPPKLVEPCILAGTSAKGCCPECGAPWKRVVEREKTFHSGSGRSGNPIAGKNGERCQGGGDTGDIRKGPCVEMTTIGWTPTCTCGEYLREIDEDGEQVHVPLDPIPCTVMDPFAGSGTVGQVAREHGRDYLLVELNPEYVEQIKERLAMVQPPLLTEVAP